MVNNIPANIIEELNLRFLVSMPEKEKTDTVRIMFRIELAHWFYLDNICKKDITMQKFKFVQFTSIMLKKCDLLINKNVTNCIRIFEKYKNKIPVGGLVIVSQNLDKVLLVQNMTTKSWGFPKGKINQGETLFQCAIREGIEEVGFDATSYARPKIRIPIRLSNRMIHLYLAISVPLDTKFEIRTIGEILDIQWFDLQNIVSNTNNLNSSNKLVSYAAKVLTNLDETLKYVSTQVDGNRNESFNILHVSTPHNQNNIESTCHTDLRDPVLDFVNTISSASTLFINHHSSSPKRHNFDEEDILGDSHHNVLVKIESPLSTKFQQDIHPNSTNCSFQRAFSLLNYPENPFKFTLSY